MPCCYLVSATDSSSRSTGLLVLIVFFGGAFGLTAFMAKKRRADAQRVAKTRGWSYTKHDDETLNRFPTWPFYLGSKRSAESVISGVFEGHNVTLFDFGFRNSQQFTTIEPGPGAVPVVRHTVPADTGIFAGFDNALAVWGGVNRFNTRAQGSADIEHWGICAMEMPGPLSPVMIWLSLPSDFAFDVVSEKAGVPTGAGRPVPDLSMRDPEFDKGFYVRAEDPKIAAALLPKATRALFVENRRSMMHDSVHFWTWDRYLFSLGTLPLDEAAVDLRLPIMAKMIENIGS